MKEKSYKVLRECNIDVLERNVYNMLNDGWDIVGGCFIEMAGTSPMYYCQTMYREKDITVKFENNGEDMRDVSEEEKPKRTRKKAES